MLDKIGRYYKHKKLFILLFILVVGLINEFTPVKKDKTVDPPNKLVLISGSNSGSIVGVMTGSNNLVTTWPMVQQIEPTKIMGMHIMWFQ